MLSHEQLTFIILVTIMITIFLIWLIVTLRLFKFQKRIENYVVVKEDVKNLSIADKIINAYQTEREKLSKKLKKYLPQALFYNKKEEEDILLFTDSIISSCFFVVIYILLIAFGFCRFSFLFSILIFLIGFDFPEVIHLIYKKKREKQIEKDLLKAITLMSHSFQAGKSMIQAVQVVSTELDGPLALEFSKIYQDMIHGLGFQTAFRRFEKRVNLSEVKYITASLTILDKTGGNMKDVFSSIEKNLYTRRSLDMELKATIASSRLVFYILLLLPICLGILLSITSPNYLQIFFTSSIGIFLFVIGISIYIIYIIIIYHIMKIEKY